MAREIDDGFYWIQECNPRDELSGQTDPPPDWYDPSRDVHMPQNAFLFADEHTLLFDTLSRAGTEHVLEELDRLLDGRALDYLVISHPETPHAGNTLDILREYPEATVVAADRRSAHDLYYLEEALKVTPGDTIDLGTYTVRFEEPVFLDHSVHLWMSEVTTNTLFTVDWLGFPHLDTDCVSFVDELECDLAEDQLLRFHQRVFIWFEYVDTTRTDAEIDFLIDEHDPEMLAPAHGLVIREDATKYMSAMKSVTRDVAAKNTNKI